MALFLAVAGTPPGLPQGGPTSQQRTQNNTNNPIMKTNHTSTKQQAASTRDYRVGAGIHFHSQFRGRQAFTVNFVDGKGERLIPSWILAHDGRRYHSLIAKAKLTHCSIAFPITNAWW